MRRKLIFYFNSTMPCAVALAPVLLLCLLLAPAAAYPTGARSAACVTRTPLHGAAPQTVLPPYSVSLTGGVYTPGTPLTVTLSGIGGSTFKGFLLQARLADGSSTVPLGTWTAAGGTKTLECSAAGDSLTHDSSSSKTSVAVQWTPPAGTTERVAILATVVQTKLTFWTDVATYTDAASSFTKTTSFVPDASALRKFNTPPDDVLTLFIDFPFGHAGVIKKVQTYCTVAGVVNIGAWRKEPGGDGVQYKLVAKGAVTCPAPQLKVTVAPSPLLTGVRATDVLGIHATNTTGVISLDVIGGDGLPTVAGLPHSRVVKDSSSKKDSGLPVGEIVLFGSPPGQTYTIPLILDIVESCSELPCGNNATCTSLSDGDYNCTCAAGFVGDNCTEDFLECASTPCKFNGTCQEGVNRYTCDCKFGYIGDNCETDEWWNPIVCIVRILQWLKWITIEDGREWAAGITEAEASSLLADFALGGEARLARRFGQPALVGQAETSKRRLTPASQARQRGGAARSGQAARRGGHSRHHLQEQARRVLRRYRRTKNGANKQD